MKCLNPDCNRGIGLVAYQRGWFGKQRYCSKHCRDAFITDAPMLQQERKNSQLVQFVVRLIAFFGLVVPATFAMAVLAAPPSRVEMPSSGCDRNLADAGANVAAMQARIKNLRGANESEMCTATRFYFLEVVKARAVTALCKSGVDRERNLELFDVDIAQINEAIASRCLQG